MHRQQYLVAPAAPPQPIPLPRMMHPTPGAYAHQHIPNDQSPSQSPTSAEAGPSSATLTPNGAPYNSPANLASQNSVMSTNDDSSNRSAARRPAVRRRTNGDDTRSESSSATSHIPKTRDGPKKKKAARACASCQKAHLTCDDSRPCQRCIKRGMGDACVEGHRKKAKYLLDEAELEALKTNQSPHTPQDKVQPTPPAQVTVPVSTPQPAQPVLQQPSDQYNSGADVLFNLPFIGDPTFTFGSEAANMEYSSLSALLGLEGLSPEQNDFQYVSAGSQPPADFAGQQQFASREWPESPSSSLSGTAVIPRPEALGIPQPPGLDGVYGGVPGAQALFGGATIGVQQGDLSQQTPVQQVPMDLVSNSYPSPGMQYQPVRQGSQSLQPQQASPQQQFPQPFQQQMRGATPKTMQSQVSTTSVTSTTAVSPPSSDSNSPADTGAASAPALSAANSKSTVQNNVVSTPAPAPTPAPVTTGTATTASTNATTNTTPVTKGHLSYVSVTKAYDYTESYHFLMKFLPKRFDKNDILRVVRALAIFRPSLIALQTPLTEEDEIFVERCFQRSLVELEKLISFSGTPTVVWRRTGEICLVGHEFCLLTEWKKEELVSVSGGKFIYELFENQSVVEYWEKFASHAFENTTQSVFSHCVLLKPSGEPIPCTFCFSIRRDIFDLPSIVIGQWLPLV